VRPIRFVYDYAHLPENRLQYSAVLDALVDPVLKHLPEAVKATEADPNAINVRYWSNHPWDVFSYHGISDKGDREAKTIGHYPYIFHSGPAWQKRYIEQGIEPDRLFQVGYAKLDPLFDGTIKQRKHTVLWAPTLRRDWPGGYDHLSGLIDELDVVKALHPRENPGTATLQALADADVVIADAGSTLYEAWALGKPVVFPDFAVSYAMLSSPQLRRIYDEQIGWHAKRPESLPKMIQLAGQNGITVAERAFIDDVFPPELRGTSGQAHADALRSIASRPLRRP
jgi:CDP-glycerol glycerophosphotransferase (TagB/SpsB family)